MAPEDESKSPLNRLEHELNFRVSPQGARIVWKEGMNVHIFPEIWKSRAIPNTLILNSHKRTGNEEPTWWVLQRLLDLIPITTLDLIPFPFYWWGNWSPSDIPGPSEVHLISSSTRNHKVFLTSKSTLFQACNRTMSISKSVGQILSRPSFSRCHKSGPLAFHWSPPNLYSALA